MKGIVINVLRSVNQYGNTRAKSLIRYSFKFSFLVSSACWREFVSRHEGGKEGGMNEEGRNK